MTPLICSNCNQPLRHGARFCAICGEPVQTDSHPHHHCPHCAGKLRPGAKFCNRCGKLISIPSTLAVPPPPVFHSQDAEPLPSTSQIPVVRGTVRKISLRYRLLHTFLIVLLASGILASLGGAYLLDAHRTIATLTPPEITPISIDTGGPELADPDQRTVQIGLSSNGRFGLTSHGGKLLTVSPIGETSNTRLWIDGSTPIFGAYGGFLEFTRNSDGTGDVVWEYEGIRVTQTLDYVLGASGQGDTVRIEYVLLNDDSVSHDIGLRIMIDTLIGNNDGVPFVIPGREGITTQAVDLQGTEIPDSIRALEIPDLVNPGVIVNLTLKGLDATPPDRVLITGWYDSEMPWDFLLKAGGLGAPLNRGGRQYHTPDSAVGLFYEPQTMAPGAQRTIVAYYGLGIISSVATGNVKLGLFAPSSVVEGEVFYITAVIADPQEGESVELRLPDELTLEAGESFEKEVEETGVDYTQISWLVRACQRVDTTTVAVSVNPDGTEEIWNMSIDAVGITRPGGVCP